MGGRESKGLTVIIIVGFVGLVAAIGISVGLGRAVNVAEDRAGDDADALGEARERGADYYGGKIKARTEADRYGQALFTVLNGTRPAADRADWEYPPADLNFAADGPCPAGTVIVKTAPLTYRFYAPDYLLTPEQRRNVVTVDEMITGYRIDEAEKYTKAKRDAGAAEAFYPGAIPDEAPQDAVREITEGADNANVEFYPSGPTPPGG